VCLAAARAVVDQGLSAHAVGPRFGVPYTTLLEWSRKYREGGAARLLPAAGRRQQQPSRVVPARVAAIVAVKRAQPGSGSRRIRDVLKRYFGLGTSATTVRRVLKQEGLAASKPRARAKPQPRGHRFERAEPNQLWQSDLFTFLLRKHERVYVAAFLDDHSRYLVSLALAHHQKSSLVLEALARGIAEYGAPREILTDQGRQYTSWRGNTEFEAELKRHGIRHVKSRPHHPQTCGKIERFWKTLWEELLSCTVFADFTDCERRIALFIQHYNFQRPHQALDGLVPADRYFRAAAPVRTAIEANVQANALRLARERSPKLPFYLVGRLGDRDLAISAAGADLKVRVGNDETTIPMGQEAEHEQGNRSARWQGGRSAAEAAAPHAAALAEERSGSGCDRQEPLPDDAVGNLRGGPGHHCDRAGQDLAGHVLQAGDPGAERDARGDEPAGGPGGGWPGRPVGGESPDRGTGGQGAVARARQAPRGAAVAVDAPHAEGADREQSARPLAAAAGSRGPAGELPWRELAAHWERTLCALPSESAGASHDEAQAGLHAAASGAGDGGAAADRGARGVVGAEDGVAGGPGTGAVAQPVPEPDAPGAECAGGAVDPATGGSAGAAAGAVGAGGGAAAAATGERQAAEPGRLDRALAGSGERAAAGPDPEQRPAAPDSQCGGARA